METINQIREMFRIESKNIWFLEHVFPQIALSDLKLEENLKKKNIMTFNNCECTCEDECIRCQRCYVEREREREIKKLNLAVEIAGLNIIIYDDCSCKVQTRYYHKSKWIIADKIDNKIPGFMLIKCNGGCLHDRSASHDKTGNFTHEIYFAYVRPEYRKKGILKNMVNQLPKDWNIWLEASSCEIENVEDIWEKCGFEYHEKRRQLGPYGWVSQIILIKNTV